MSVIRIGTRIIDLRRAVGRGAGGGGLDPAAFVTEWTVSTGDTIKLPSYDASPSGFTMDYDVDWGDGSSDSGVALPDKTHTYTFLGGGTKTFQVVITGQLGAFNMARASATERGYLTKMVQWGTDNVWSSLKQMFYELPEITYEATDFPNLTNLVESTSINNFVKDCPKITSLDLSMWTNTDNITNMSYCIYTHSSSSSALATLNLTGWDTSNVTTFSNAFNRTGDPTTGCDFIMPNLDVSSSTTFASAFSSTKIKSINIVGWTLRAAGVSLASMFNTAIEGTVGTNFSIAATGWTNTSGITSLNRFVNACQATSLDLTGWDTSSVTTFAIAFSYAINLTHITGLNGFDSSAATTIESMFNNAKVLNFGAGATTNFGSNWGPNLGSCLSFKSTFYYCGYTTPGTAPPNVTDWDVSSVTTMSSMFYQCKWTGGGNPDMSGWNISSSCTNVTNFARNSSFTEINLSDSSCDLSGVTTMNYFAYDAILTRFILNATLAKPDFSNCTSFLNSFTDSTLVSGDYDQLLLKLDADGQSSVTLSAGDSKYEPTNVDSGTTDGVAANKLIQSGQNFVTTVSINDIVYNIPDETYAKVTAVDDNETLSLDLDIMVSGEGYEIQSSAAAKARYAIDITKTWVVTDGGPV